MTIPAVGHYEFGEPDVLTVVQIPRPRPGAGQVRIQVRAAAVNPTDTLSRCGLAGVPGTSDAWPLVPGYDLAGDVVEVGPGVDWKVGDKVAGVVRPGERTRPGAYASEVVVDADSAVAIPAGSDYAAASTLLMNGLTAMHALDLLGLPEGATLGVTGAAGAVGLYAVGLAKARGLRVVADAREEDDAALVASAGADQVVPRGDRVADHFADAVGGRVDGVLDAALIGPAVADAVRDGGGIAVVRPTETEFERGIARHDVRVPTYMHDQDRLRDLVDLVEEGRLALRVAASFAPEEAAEAHRVLAAGGVRGRLVIEWPS